MRRPRAIHPRNICEPYPAPNFKEDPDAEGFYCRWCGKFCYIEGVEKCQKIRK